MINIGPIQGTPPGSDDQTAAEVPNTPAGTIAATDVQAAINELDTEKLANIVEDTTPQLGGDLDGQGNSLVACQSVANLAAQGSALYLDGENDAVNLDALAAELVNVNNTEGAIVWKGKIHDFTINDQRLWAFSDTNANETISLKISNTNYKVSGYSNVGGVNQWTFEIDGVLVENTGYEIVVAHDGIAPILYVNGKIEPITFTTDIDKLVWFGGVSGVDNGRIGCKSVSSSGNISFLNCTVNKFYALNVCPTAAEVLAMYEGGNVPYKYIGASQNEQITQISGNSDNSNFLSDTGWWTTHLNVDINVSTSGKCHLELVPSGQGSIYKASLLTLGKYYRIAFTISGYSSGAIKVEGGTYDSAIVMANGTYIFEFLCVGNTDLYITSYGGGDTTLDLDDILITQIGAVGQYEQDGICHSQLLDKSSNKLHGEISGAVPINLPVNHTERFMHTVAITDDTTWTDIIPTGYELEKIIFIESAGNTATLDLGTVATGNDVFKNQIITANSITTVVINKTFSMSATQSLFLNDDDAGSSWNSASITTILLMRRIV